jgi:flagellar protein FlbD
VQKKKVNGVIFVTKMNNEVVLLNNDLIETIEETPDTVVTLTTGKKFIIKESSKEILQKVIEFKMKIYNGDYDRDMD